MTDNIIVIGGGLAGLTAANRATALGLKATVLEQGSDAEYFCNSRLAGGIIHVAFRDVTQPVDDIKATVAGQTGENDATALSPLLAEEGSRALAWVREEGAKFVKGGQLEFQRWIMAPPRHRGAGLDWKGRGPDVTLRRLTANLEQRGGTVRRGVRGKELIVENGTVTGVVTESGERLSARAVVIADGGFQANLDLVRKYISPAPEKLIQRGAATGFGAGMTMAEAIGAKLIGMDRFYGHLLGRQAFEIEKLWPYPVVDPIATACILVDKSGKRFTDEGMGGVYMANEVAKLADPLSATVIFDEAVWTGLAADNRYPPCMNPVFEQAGGTVLQAPDLAGIAAQIGVPADALQATVAQFNDAVANNCTTTLTPAHGTHRAPPQAIVTPPFRAIPVCAGITYTMGGIAVDRDSRVQHRDGGAIPGLFAAGSSTGGFEGGPNAAYIGGLSKAIITGLRAAEAIAGMNG
jgi:fumarate reductase flavoprotein subunit